MSAEYVTAYEGCLVGVLQMPVPKHVPYGFQYQLHLGTMVHPCTVHPSNVTEIQSKK